MCNPVPFCNRLRRHHSRGASLVGDIIPAVQLLHPLLVAAIHLQTGLVLLGGPVPPPVAHRKRIILLIACVQCDTQPAA